MPLKSTKWVELGTIQLKYRRFHLELISSLEVISRMSSSLCTHEAVRLEDLKDFWLRATDVVSGFLVFYSHVELSNDGVEIDGWSFALHL